MYKLGIDVGGTNTDAVLIDENLKVVAAVKNPTSGDIYEGIMGAVDAVLAQANIDRKLIKQAMLGTTQCTNAIVERKGLALIAILRIGAPASVAFLPWSIGPTILLRLPLILPLLAAALNSTASVWPTSMRLRAAPSSRA